MKRLSLICLLFALFGCESIFFEQYKIINPKIYKKDLQYYKVIKGDNLYSISKKFNIPIQKIIKSNKIKSPFKIFPNQKIFLPSNKVYSVIKGDTLYSISRKFKTDLYSLSHSLVPLIRPSPGCLEKTFVIKLPGSFIAYFIRSFIAIRL